MTDLPIPTTRAPIRSWRHDTARNGRTLTTAFGLGLSAAAGLSMPAVAQDTTGATEIDAILVEGQDGEAPLNVESSADSRFTAPLLDTPKTVTVLPAELLEERGITTLEEVFRTTPGISMNSGEGGTPNADRPIIRGFSAENSVLVDGMRDPGAQSRGTFNLEQVEIVKGADSAFSGRGGAGGSINLVSKTAKDYEFTRGSLTYGTDQTAGATLDSNFVLSDTIAARINLMKQSGGIAGRDDVEESSFGGAATISFGMNTPFRSTLSYSHYEEDNTPDYGIPWIAGTGDLADVDYDNFYGLSDRDFQESSNDSATMRFEYDLNPTLMISNTTRFTKSSLEYIATNPDDSAGNVANGYVWRSVKSRGSETESWYNLTELTGTATTGRLRHSFALGVEISKEESTNAGYSVDTDADPLDPNNSRNCTAALVGAASNYNCTSLFNPNPGDPWSGSVARSTSATTGSAETLSIFAFDTIEFNEKWQANFGLRYDNFHVERETAGGRGGPYSGESDSEFFTYQLGAVYKPRPNGSIYLSFATAAEPAGLSNGEGGDNLSTAVEDLDPVRTTSLELGTKWDLYNGNLSLNAAIFENKTSNARVSDNGVTKNLGENRVRGFELGLAGNINDRWTVFGGYTYLDAVIIDDGDGSNAGNEFPNTPKHSFNVWSTYEATPQLTLGGGATYRSSQFGDSANTREFDGFWRLDAMAQYQFNDKASLRLFINNLTDNRYIEKSYSTHYATVAAGRSINLTANFEF
ncbi:TonB-dependent siderophore receptor [Puniceibacterium sp. IMCC21224]|uniref:TonB-dependent receptor n=1 Tax=Puniceibacterium sp. IMCC21224 TaxID=1618204 RepID=UPI00064DCDA7|nr:TonB-dependent siderophore receptor [Puniceibacterium sp. IMCC21224]KMK66998.1 TonB-dependent siderophore receptor [Puniceibacterium sp. IMCC21224]